jgi:hypothetical protein
MKFSLLIILSSLFFLGCQTGGKTSREPMMKKNNVSKPVKVEANKVLTQKSIYEELTGKKGLTSKQMPRRILELARDAKWRRDYVTALKRYNTLIVKYPKSAEVKEAYLDKAALYKEMGLMPQSKFNLQKAK